MADDDTITETEVYDEEGNLLEDSTAFPLAVEQLKTRCAASGITCEVFGEDRYAVVHLPAGRDKRAIYLFSTEDIQRILAVKFEEYVFLGNYQAVCSYKEGKIVAGLRAMGPGARTFFERRVLPQTDSENKAEQVIRIARDQGAEIISVGKILDESIALLPPGFLAERGIAIKLEGLAISQHDQALRLLERVANSLLFQIDLAFDVPLGLARNRRPVGRRGTRNDARNRIELNFPKTEYDAAPISLYWYARGATGMPLLQFLAYYQSIEYYFPVYAQAEAQRKIKNILKDPSFRLEREADIGKILMTLKGTGWGFGDERSQLRATIQECLDPDQLRAFFTSDEKRAEFFSSKTKGLTQHRIFVQNENADLRNEVAERIYEIRCKIVHTKVGAQEGNVELLLPFSREAEQLFFDIELIQYVAQQVLIATSSAFNI